MNLRECDVRRTGGVNVTRTALWRFLVAIGAVFTLVLAACGDDSDDAGGDTSGGGATTQAQSEGEEAGEPEPVELEDTVVVAGSGGDLGQSYIAALTPWAEENGVRIQWVEGLATDHVGRLVAQKNNPEIDLYQAELVSHFAAARQDVFEAFDPDLVPNLASFPELAVAEDGAAVNHIVEVVGAWWNTDRLTEAGLEPPATWDDFWALLEEPALQGRVVMPAIDNGYMRSWIAFQLDDAADPTPIYERLAAVDGSILEYARTPAAMHDLAVSGQAWLGVNGFTRILDMVEANIGVDYTIPNPAPLVPMSWSLVRDAPNPNAAQSLINYVLSPEGQRAIAEATGLSPMLPDVEVAGDQFLSAEDIENAVPWDYATVEENLETWRTQFASTVRSTE